MSTLSKQVKKLPENPGVYYFLGSKGQILYIGKATSLHDRVASYFRTDLGEARGPLIVSMMPLIRRVEYRETDSVLEALLLETDLIKKWKPKFNTREKDDKSYNCVVITDEDFPRVLVVRKKDLESGMFKAQSAKGKVEAQKLKTVYGPFPQGSSLKEAMKIIRKIFPYRDKCTPCPFQRNSASSQRLSAACKACFNAQIGLCPGVCVGKVTKKEYAQTIAELELFFEGKKEKLVRTLEREMAGFAKQQEFEKANEVKRRIFALNHIHDVALIRKEGNEMATPQSGGRIESYDIAHTSGTETVGVMTVVEEGAPNKAEYRKFKILSAKSGSDIHALKELLTRRLNHPEWPFPKLIVVDGGIAQKNLFEAVLQAAKLSIPVVSVVKDARHRPDHILGDESIVKKMKREILLANSESHRFAITFHRKRLGNRMKPSWLD